MLITGGVFSGPGDCFPRGARHLADEPGGTHSARHGGNVTGESPAALPGEKPPSPSVYVQPLISSQFVGMLMFSAVL